MRRRNWVGALGAVLVAPWLVAVPAVPASAVEPTCAGQPATIVGTDASDWLTGTEGPDVVSLGAGRDVFEGGDGEDVICGGPDNDYLWGNEGPDWIYGEGGSDSIGEQFLYCQCGSDRLHGGADNDKLLVPLGPGSQAPGETGVLVGGAGVDYVELGNGTYTEGVVVDVPEGTMTGAGSYEVATLERWGLTLEHDVFQGGPGDEIIISAKGDDQLSMGAGRDRVDIISGTTTGASLHMGPGADYVITGSPGRHRVWLGSGDDVAWTYTKRRVTVFAGPGDDRVGPFGEGLKPFSVWGGSGRDFLTFSRARPVLHLDARAGAVRMGPSLHRFSGFERYRGTREGDTLLGTRSRDWIDGWDGRDVIRGRAGNDVLIGGKGPDVIRGEGGRDVCDRGNTLGCERLR